MYGHDSPSPTSDPRRSGMVDNAIAALELLDRSGLTVAPHVATQLAAGYAGDPAAIVQGAQSLSRAQRLGHSLLPDPLPCVPAVEQACAETIAALDDAQRLVLLTAAVSVIDRTELLLRATSLSIGELIEAPVSDALLLVAGHVTFADPRLRIWAHETATLAERTDAHERLAAAARELDDGPRVLWHTSLSSLAGDARLTGPLLRMAEAADAQGETPCAFAIAREALSHADAASRADAERAAAAIAFGAGLVEDLRELDGDREIALPENAPLRRAHKGLTKALALAERGDLTRSRELLMVTAIDLPIAACDDGVAGALAARLSLLIDGREDALSRALSAAGPRGIHRSDLTERAILAEFARLTEDAAALSALAAERGDDHAQYLPGFDLGDLGGEPGDRAHGAVGSDVRLARRARAVIRATDRGRFARDRERACALGRQIRSPYERALTEYTLARVSASLAQVACARGHLRAAEHLFVVAGASAWVNRVRAEGLPRPTIDVVVPAGGPTAVTPLRRDVATPPAPQHPVGADPLAGCRRQWADVLTERELQVALMVVSGATNRAVAGRLRVSVRTVEVHIGRVFSKLGVHGRVELTVLAHRGGVDAAAGR